MAPSKVKLNNSTQTFSSQACGIYTYVYVYLQLLINRNIEDRQPMNPASSCVISSNILANLLLLKQVSLLSCLMVVAVVPSSYPSAYTNHDGSSDWPHQEHRHTQKQKFSDSSLKGRKLVMRAMFSSSMSATHIYQCMNLLLRAQLEQVSGLMPYTLSLTSLQTIAASMTHVTMTCTKTLAAASHAIVS